jgi:pyruvate ferredoxin oxidoreductase beta subunit
MTGAFDDAAGFLDRVVSRYESGAADRGLAATSDMARSFIPASTAGVRDFWSMSPDLPAFDAGACVGCMECVTECPDTAILARVIAEPDLPEALETIHDPEDRAHAASLWARPKKYAENFEKKGLAPGRFGVFVDPAKCKGCGECVTFCGDRGALRMVPKTEALRSRSRAAIRFHRSLGPTPKEYIVERSLMDMMLHEPSATAFCGGAGSCMGCGETTAIRMMLAATRFTRGPESLGIVAATGCNTVYGSTYPYNPYGVPWTSSLFENAAPVAMGIRAAWDRRGWSEKKLWVFGGDGAFYDIGFQALSRMLAAGADIKVLVLDTQSYSNTGGQASTSTFTSQETKYTAVGAAQAGKIEKRKELGLLATMHPDTFVAQTTPAHTNHFYKAILAANEFRGPAVVISYAACMPEHGVGDDRAAAQARLAVESRAFPLFVYDPRRGPRLRDRFDLTGNPAMKQDWSKRPAGGETVDFVSFARTEGRFARQFAADGRPSEALLAAQADRLENWRRLQELAGVAP